MGADEKLRILVSYQCLLRLKKIYIFQPIDGEVNMEISLWRQSCPWAIIRLCFLSVFSLVESFCI